MANADRVTVPKSWPDLGAVITHRLIDLAFQPIVHLVTGKVVAVEALTRPRPESGYPNPGVLFAAAEVCNLSWDLEKVVRDRLAEQAGSLPEDRMLFFNTSPGVFADERYLNEIERFRETSGLDPSRFVLEITERAECGESDLLTRNALALREKGYQIAIDDMGAGSSGLNRIMTLRPAWLKLDRELARGIDTDSYRQNLIRFLGYFTRLGGARLIAEGVEEISELNTLFDLGADCVQGFALAKPGAIDQELPESIVAWMRERGASVIHETHTVEHLQSVEPLLLPLSACQVQPQAGAKPIDVHAPIAAALTALSDREDIALLPPILATSQSGGRLALRPADLLRAAAKQLSEESLHSSPMFEMPDSFACDLAMHDRIASASPSDAAIIDIRRMSEYNLVVGHDLGDVLLRHLASLLRSIAAMTPNTFVGHLGDDRFLLIAPPSTLGDLVEELVIRFDRASVRYASPAGTTGESPDRASADRWLDAPTLRVVIMPSVFSLVANPRELRIAAESARRTANARTVGGSSLVVMEPEQIRASSPSRALPARDAA